MEPEVGIDDPYGSLGYSVILSLCVKESAF